MSFDVSSPLPNLPARYRSRYNFLPPIPFSSLLSLPFLLLTPLPLPSLFPSPRFPQVVLTECSKQGRQRQLDNCGEERYSTQPQAGQEGDEGRGTSSDPTSAESRPTRHGDYCSSPGLRGWGGGRGSALAKSSLSHKTDIKLITERQDTRFELQQGSWIFLFKEKTRSFSLCR
jgi:hypothetical protein